jgi:transglutaminase-like putative cysteine protease
MYTVRFKAGQRVIADLNKEAARQAGTDTSKDRAKPADRDKGKPEDKDKAAPADKGKPADKDKGKPDDDDDKPADKDKGKPADKAKPTDKDKGKPTDKDKGKPTDKDKSKPDDEDKPADKDKGTEKLPAPKTEDKDKGKPADKDKGKPDDDKDEPRKEASARTRTFEFIYAATVTGLQAGKKAKVWVPVAGNSDDQTVELLFSEVRGGDAKAAGTIHASKSNGNHFFFVETTPDADGKMSLKLVYKVTRREVKGQTPVKENDRQLARLLQADALVPISGKPLSLIEDRELPDDPLKKARALYDTVNEHMTYSKKGTGWGRGDSVWACDSKYGNCSDFHSLFISLSRAQKMPAKFEIGFPLPAKRGAGKVEGYHCWAFFRPPGKGWVPVDISEANKDPKLKDYYFGNLSPDRVTFSTGRDIELAPRQGGKPVNFLIYPYAEVDGKEYPQAKIEKQFGFKDL